MRWVRDSRNVIRRLTAAALVLLVQLAALSAPLLHVHADDHGDHDALHHQGRTRHAHFHGHASGSPGSGPEFDHDDREEATAAPLFVAAVPDPVDTSALPSPLFALVVPPELAIGRTPHVTHGHDPPAVVTLGARPPPAF